MMQKIKGYRERKRKKLVNEERRTREGNAEVIK
jgi:hypothetical protein